MVASVQLEEINRRRRVEELLLDRWETAEPVTAAHPRDEGLVTSSGGTGGTGGGTGGTGGDHDGGGGATAGRRVSFDAAMSDGSVAAAAAAANASGGGFSPTGEFCFVFCFSV